MLLVFSKHSGAIGSKVFQLLKLVKKSWMNKTTNQVKYGKIVNLNSKFYNRPIKSWFEKNDIEMYSTHNERKSVIAERFIRTLKSKIYK